jgi:hypothetical protein
MGRSRIAWYRILDVFTAVQSWLFESWRLAFLRLALAGAALTLVAGCASPTRTGPTFDAVRAPAAKQARIVVLRDKAMGDLFDVGWQAQLDGAPLGDLKTGTFVYRNVPAGPHKLTFARSGDMARESSRELVAASGRTYVFRLELNEKGRWVTAANSQGGVLPLLLISAAAHAADERGLFDFTVLEGAAASEALSDLHLAE